MTLLCVALGLIWPRWQRVSDIKRLRELDVDIEFVEYETFITIESPPYTRTGLGWGSGDPFRENLWVYLDRSFGEGFFCDIQSFRLQSQATPFGDEEAQSLGSIFEIIARYPEKPCDFHCTDYVDENTYELQMSFRFDQDAEIFAKLGSDPRPKEAVIAKWRFTEREAEILLQFPNLTRITLEPVRGSQIDYLAGINKLSESRTIEEVVYGLHNYPHEEAEAAIEAICRIPSLKRLELNWVDLTATSIVAIGNVETLEEITLNHASLEHIVSVTEHLKGTPASREMANIFSADMQTDGDPFEDSSTTAFVLGSQFHRVDAPMKSDPNRVRFISWSQFKNLRSLSFCGTNLTNDDLACLGRDPQPTRLSPLNVPISSLYCCWPFNLHGALANLERLDLSETEITDAGLISLPYLESLREVSLRQLPVTKRGWDALLEYVPELESVEVGGTKLSVKDLTNQRNIHITMSE